MILRCLALLAALRLAIADVAITTPAAGDSVTGTSLEISWEESGKKPPISDFASYAMFLCAGGNLDTNFIQLYTLVAAGDYKKGSTVTVTVPSTIGGPDTNAYFIKVLSAATGGSIINFSDRFSLPSMTGVFPASVVAGLKTVTGTSGPPTVNDVQSPQNNPAADPAPVAVGGSASFALPYTMQTGAVRYAPMPKPGQTKITAKNPSPLYATSNYNVFATYGGSADCVSTATEPITYALTTQENPNAAAGQPTDIAMQKYLNRWKD